MKTNFLIFAGIVILSGCNTTIPYKEGSSIAEYERVLYQCKIQANKEVIPRYKERITPITEVPLKKTCTKTKSENGLSETLECEEVGGYTIGGEVIREDINTELRKQFVNQCISGKGYANITLPLCKSNQKPNYRLTKSSSLQPLGQSSCIVSGRNQTGWVVNP